MWTYDIKVFGHSDLATCAPIGSAKYCEALVSIDICTCVIHIIAIFLLPIMVAKYYVIQLYHSTCYITPAVF